MLHSVLVREKLSIVINYIYFAHVKSISHNNLPTINTYKPALFFVIVRNPLLTKEY